MTEQSSDIDHHDRVLTLLYEVGTGGVRTDGSKLLGAMSEPMKHRCLDKLHEVLDPEGTWT